MLGGKKIIAVCLAKVHDDFNKDFVTYLYMHAKENDHKLIIFNSLLDLYNSDLYDEGSRAVFNIMNFDVIDAVVILHESFCDKSVTGSIALKAKAKNIPVIVVHGEEKGCVCIKKEYEEAYKHIIRHILKDHGARDIFFIGGRTENDESTEIRLKCCRDVMAEFGLTLTDDCIAYGEYWDRPTKKIIREILAERGSLPQAVICANDSMAVAACEEIMLHGYSVPEDVIVTGFDGLNSAEYFAPRLTTCKEDIPKLASIITDAINNGTTDAVLYDRYYPYISESCGCGDDKDINYRERERYLYNALLDIKGHEFHIYNWVDRILETDNINSLTNVLRDYVLPNSAVCLRNDFLMSAVITRNEKSSGRLYDNLLVVSSRKNDYASGKQVKFPIKNMIPGLEKWLEDSSMCVITSIFVEDYVCGYYCVKTFDIQSAGHKIFRLSKIMNVAFSSLINRMRNKDLQNTMKKAAYIDTLTELPNLKGLAKWFDEYHAEKENREKTLIVSIYSIPQYKYIYENYGIQDIEEAVQFVAQALKLANFDNGFIAHTSEDEFIIVNYCDTPDMVGDLINDAVSVFFGLIEEYNSGNDKEYFVEVNCGCTVVNPGWNNTLQSFIQLAEAEMYMNRLKAGGLGPVTKDDSKPPEKTPKDKYNEFKVLIEKNLFTYYFQPIVNARTGEIVAYEALMRTTGGIKMSPFEILEIAKEYGRLYDIEKATMFNVLSRYESDREKFGKTKVFVNTIPGCFLHTHDLSEFKNKYGYMIGNIVFEITEQDTVTDDELDAMRMLGIGGDTGGQVAVDDYGTGHSNIVNLLRYTPQVIKIDRFLVSNIQNDPNKQMFVKNTIEFAKMNNIKILAEGVETLDELRTVIDYGVDLIQGYYTARPAPEPIRELPENIRMEIVNENLSLSKLDNDLLTYFARDGETIDLYDLALEKYAKIRIGNGIVKLKGGAGATVDITVVTDDDSICVLTLEDVELKGTSGPAVQIGANSVTELILSGKNVIHRNGISVPETASLHITGSGDLDIKTSKNSGVGIGANFDTRYGSISFEFSGKINIEMNGDRVAAIGGVGGINSALRFISGRINILANGINVIGAGSVSGKAIIFISKTFELTVKAVGLEAVAVGAVDGTVSIASSGKLNVTADGESVSACGSIKGSSTIAFEKGYNSAVVHGDAAVCIGTLNGKTNIKCVAGFVNAYGEGDRVCGIGSLEGSALTQITGGTVGVKILSGAPVHLGNENSVTKITGGNIIIDKKYEGLPINELGETLYPYVIDADEFSKAVKTELGEYIYRAQKLSGDEQLIVYLPRKYTLHDI